MPGAVIACDKSWPRAGIRGRYLTAMANRRLKLHRLIGVLRQVIGARQRSPARIARVGSATKRIGAVVVVTKIRMTFETHLIFSRQVGTDYGSTRTITCIAAFYVILKRQAEELCAAVYRFHAPATA